MRFQIDIFLENKKYIQSLNCMENNLSVCSLAVEHQLSMSKQTHLNIMKLAYFKFEIDCLFSNGLKQRNL